LNENKIYSNCICNKTKEKKPIKISTKKDLIKHIKQFWKFYRLYSKEELGKEIPNITEYLRLRKENEELDVDFLDFKEILELSNCCIDQKKKTLILFAFETGGRGIEYLNVKRKHFLFNNESNNWTVILPQLKGVSHNKRRIDLDISSKEIDKYFKMNNFNQEELIFNYDYDYWRQELKRIGKEILKKNITPKIFRKSCAMFLSNQNINESYIKAHLGWSPDTKSLKHYQKQISLKKPNYLKKNIEKEIFPDFEMQQKLVNAELEKMKNKMESYNQFFEDKMTKLTQKIEDINLKNMKDEQTKEILKEMFSILKVKN
jgi:integrase